MSLIREMQNVQTEKRCYNDIKSQLHILHKTTKTL